MDIVISPTSTEPIYEQIYFQISSQIMQGILEPEYCLPSIRTISKELGISVITVKKAWDMLEAQNFIYTRAGKGCYVTAHKEEHLDNKKIQFASQRLDADLEYYRKLGISKKELISLIEEKY